jgi:hypothetical protein
VRNRFRFLRLRLRGFGRSTSVSGPSAAAYLLEDGSGLYLTEDGFFYLLE